ncbi:MAG: long-chain fatty acid--CoA ligase, partial [Candidatus Saccharimonadales bacterium]
VGAIVVADVVLRTASQADGRDARAVQSDILLFCRQTLSSHKVPAAINFVPALAVAESGKMMRGHA